MRDRFETLRRELLRRGWTAGQTERAVREVQEHWEDLAGEGRENGLDAAAAAASADQRLGDLAHLADEFVRTMRRATWWGRHPLIGFVVLPPVALLVWFAAWLLSLAALAEAAHALLPSLSSLTEHGLLLAWTVYGVHYLGLVMVPALFCWLARRAYAGPYWSWCACGICAIHGFFNQVNVRPHSLSWGYGFGRSGAYLAIALPLLVACLAAGWERRQRASIGRDTTRATPPAVESVS